MSTADSEINPDPDPHNATVLAISSSTAAADGLATLAV